MSELKDKLKSVRVKLFLTMCAVIMIIVVCLIIANNIVLETFYIYSKTNTVKEVYSRIDNYYKHNSTPEGIEEELKRIAFNNNFDIYIRTSENILIFSTDRDFISTLNRINTVSRNLQSRVMYKDENIVINKINDEENRLNYLLLTGTLNNGYSLYIRIPVVPIEESVRISNNALILIGGITILIAAFIASFVSKKFTDPILQLNDIANKMAKLDFSKKYRTTDTEDEINELGKSINIMSDKLERTIKQLRANNIELEKDIEEKSKIDEMRKQFISDVSHELKTPIALIQGYAEGLIENVNTDEESKRFYAEVILDESNKMDKLVKQLLELMKLEYGSRDFENTEFNIIELINEVIRKCNVMVEENKIEVKFKNHEIVKVNADEFYIEQVVTNYFTNAVKHAKEIEGKKEIQINVKNIKEKNKVRVSVFNTGMPIKEEDLERVWTRFYKADSSRNREDGGSGIGLAIVKAIMTNYENNYGVVNHENGVEFYFELNGNKANN